MDGIGTRVKRLEDPLLLRGEGSLASDIKLPGQPHMRVVRAGMPHASIAAIDPDEGPRCPAWWRSGPVRPVHGTDGMGDIASYAIDDAATWIAGVNGPCTIAVPLVRSIE